MATPEVSDPTIQDSPRFDFFKSRMSNDQRKTVTFGDASAVRSKPFWSLVSLLLIIGFWWLATTPFGFDDSFKPVVDEKFDLAADEAQIRIDERIAAGNPNIPEAPSRQPLERDYLTECGQEWDRAQTTITEELTAEGIEEPRSPRVPGGAATDEQRAEYEAAVVAYERDSPGYEATRDERAAAIAGCNPSDYSQWLSPRTLPSPRDTWTQFNRLRTTGFQQVTLWSHTKDSLWRVIRGMFFGIVIGVPVGLAMGLSSRLRGFFDTPVEGFRTIPPLALLPLFILWFGIGDGTAVNLLIFASVWIMIISARAGAGTVQLSKVRAAYSLGASKWQVLTRVILPNALPELFTGARVALGVSWGTLVAAELVGADTGLGAMIFVARDFLRTDVVVVGIIVIAVFGVLMDIVMRILEAILIPWRGKG